MLMIAVCALLVAVASATEEASVFLAPALDPNVPKGVPVVQDAPLAVAAANTAPLTLQQPTIEISEPLILPEQLEERQDTVVRQTSSSGKLQHILRAHYVGQLDNEQKFEAQDSAEPAPLPKTPIVSLNEHYYEQVPVPVPVPAPVPVPEAYPAPYPYPAYPPQFPYYPQAAYPAVSPSYSYPAADPYGASLLQAALPPSAATLQQVLPAARV